MSLAELLDLLPRMYARAERRRGRKTSNVAQESNHPSLLIFGLRLQFEVTSAVIKRRVVAQALKATFPAIVPARETMRERATVAPGGYQHAQNLIVLTSMTAMPRAAEIFNPGTPPIFTREKCINTARKE